MTDTNYDLNAITLKLNNILIIANLQLTIIFSCTSILLELLKPCTLVEYDRKKFVEKLLDMMS